MVHQRSTAAPHDEKNQPEKLVNLVNLVSHSESRQKHFQIITNLFVTAAFDQPVVKINMYHLL